VASVVEVIYMLFVDCILLIAPRRELHGQDRLEIANSQHFAPLLKAHADPLRGAPRNLAGSRQDFRLDDEVKTIGDSGWIGNLQASPTFGDVTHDAINGGRARKADRTAFV
jgi:hypothetical protein